MRRAYDGHKQNTQKEDDSQYRVDMLQNRLGHNEHDADNEQRQN